MSRPRAPPPKIVQEEEPEEMDEEDEEFDEEMDMIEPLASLLATEEGETVATALAGLKDATERIALTLEMQNKVLVKIAAALNKMVPAAPATLSDA